MEDTTHQQGRWLSGQMLERELAQVNNNVKLEIEKETNLTIGLF